MNQNYINYLNSMKRSEHTIKMYTLFINEMLDIIKKNEKDITYSDLLYWKSCFSNCSPSTLNTKMFAVKNYFKFLNQIGEIDNDPSAKLEKLKDNPKVKKYISAEYMQKIINNMYTAQSKAMVVLLASTGMRYSEMANITIDQYMNAIATDRAIIILGKGNKERVIYINEIAEKYINDYLSKNYKNNKSTNKLFVSADASSLRKSLILSATKSNLTYAKEISPHWLRMFYATNAIENGIDLATIRDCLGHSDISVTSRYVKSCDKKVKNAMTQDFIFGN